MSINLYIYGKREIKIVETGKYDFQTEAIDIFQTPTETTEQILRSFYPINSYYIWVSSLFEDKPNIAKDHIIEIKNKIQKMKNEGYKIYFEEI